MSACFVLFCFNGFTLWLIIDELLGARRLLKAFILQPKRQESKLFNYFLFHLYTEESVYEPDNAERRGSNPSNNYQIIIRMT